MFREGLWFGVQEPDVRFRVSYLGFIVCIMAEPLYLKDGGQTKRRHLEFSAFKIWFSVPYR